MDEEKKLDAKALEGVTGGGYDGSSGWMLHRCPSCGTEEKWAPAAGLVRCPKCLTYMEPIKFIHP